MPNAFFDVVDNVLGGGGSTMFSTYSPVVASNIAEGSPITMDARFVMATATAGTLFVHVDVMAAVTTTNNYAHFVVVEEGLTTYGTTPGLARAVLSDEAFTLTTPGQSVDYVKTFTLSGSWSLPNVSFVCFVETHNTPKTVIQAVRAECRDGIRVTPGDEWYAVGDQGGPYAPPSQAYSVANRGNSSVNYSVTATQPWITVTNGSGTIAGHDSVDVTVEINQLAGMLATGIYHDALTFTNTTNQLGTTTRGVTLQVGEYVLLYDFPLDTDPGWACQRLWAFGQPTGQGGEYGSPDPTGGHTGPNCYGYNLSGDYENSLTKQWYLTTPGFDFTGYTGVQVRYWRWLGVEGTYDHAFFLANRPEEPWTAIWSSASEIADSQWTQVTHDLSAVADLQPSVILHWSMGPTNASKQYCGWNIDDIQLWGIPYAAAGVPDTDASERLALLPSSPNPFREAATIAYSLPEAGRVTVGVYDVAGRLVRNVVDGAVEAGLHAAQWDGRDGSGRPVAAGVYFCRIVALGETDTRSMVLLK